MQNLVSPAGCHGLSCSLFTQQLSYGAWKFQSEENWLTLIGISNIIRYVHLIAEEKLPIEFHYDPNRTPHVHDLGLVEMALLEFDGKVALQIIENPKLTKAAIVVRTERSVKHLSGPLESGLLRGFLRHAVSLFVANRPDTDHYFGRY
jgi:hypothetical protein